MSTRFYHFQLTWHSFKVVICHSFLPLSSQEITLGKTLRVYAQSYPSTIHSPPITHFACSNRDVVLSFNFPGPYTYECVWWEEVFSESCSNIFGFVLKLPPAKPLKDTSQYTLDFAPKPCPTRIFCVLVPKCSNEFL